MNAITEQTIDGLLEQVQKLEDRYDELCNRMEDDAIVRDQQEYLHLQTIMRLISEDFHVAGVNSMAYQLAWRLSEDIKNQHGGMPPKAKE